MVEVCGTTAGYPLARGEELPENGRGGRFDMSTTQIVWTIVVVVVVLVLLAVLAGLLRTRSSGHRRRKAEEIRTEASTQVADVQRSHHDASRAEADAQRARAQAEQAEARAGEARRAADQERAGYEDRLREADRIDPDVDHETVDYSSDTPPPTRPTT
jgi:flagellar biosynthesis/type III secretory pathway M-ring protein FliF/YscJ